MLFSVDTKVRGRFSEKRCGPSGRCERNASAALENFVCYPQKTFSTASTQLRHLPLRARAGNMPVKPAGSCDCCSQVRNKVLGSACPSGVVSLVVWRAL